LLAGIGWLAALNGSAASWQVAAGLFVLGIGLGLIWTPACSLNMGACTAADQGFASGAIALSRSFFGVLGIAVLGTLLAVGMAPSLYHHAGTWIAQHPQAFVNGWHLALWVAAAVTVVFGVVIYAFIPVHRSVMVSLSNQG
jgi:hypothetical protein